MKTARLGGVVLPFFFIAALFAQKARSEGLCLFDTDNLSVIELDSGQLFTIVSPYKKPGYAERCHNLLMSAERQKNFEIVVRWGQADIGVPSHPPEFVPQVVRCKKTSDYLSYAIRQTGQSGKKTYIKLLEMQCGSSLVAAR